MASLFTRLAPFSGKSFCAFLIAGVITLMSPGANAASPWTQLFVFGDSFSDTGAGYVDCDGPTAIAYVAEDLGLSLVPAGSGSTSGTRRSVNFAVSGGQTGEGEGRRIKQSLLGRGMITQVKDFSQQVHAGELNFEPETTLFFIAGGLNDAALPTAQSVNNLRQIVGHLHAAGARDFRIAVLPESIAAFAAAGKKLNRSLPTLIAELRKAYPTASISLSAWGTYFDQVLSDPKAFGFSNTTEACAGRALFDQDTTPRGNPREFFYYHDGHPSTAVHRIVANHLRAELADRARD